MDTAKCRALLTVLKHGNLAHAAEDLGYTTSGISRMMHALERELGFPLLLRSKVGVKPTPECAQMLPILTQLATLGETCEQQAALIRGVEVGRIRVGCAYRAFYEPLATILTSFTSAHPGIQADMIARNSTPLVRALERGDLDLAIISRREGDFEWTHLFDDPMVVLVPVSHPLAESDSYPIERLAVDPFIELYPDEESDNSRTLAQYGIHPKSHNTVREAREARELVAVGLGVTMVNNIYANKTDARVRHLPLQPAVEVSIGVATTHQELASPIARAFASYALPRLRTAAKRIEHLHAS